MNEINYQIPQNNQSISELTPAKHTFFSWFGFFIITPSLFGLISLVIFVVGSPNYYRNVDLQIIFKAAPVLLVIVLLYAYGWFIDTKVKNKGSRMLGIILGTLFFLIQAGLILIAWALSSIKFNF